MLRKHFRFDDKTNPTTRLAQLFQADAELVNEIGPTFRGTSFFIIWRGRSPAAYQLTSDVSTHSRVRQRINNLAYTRGKVLVVRPTHPRSRMFLRINFQFALF